jgi:hypothetical protein
MHEEKSRINSENCRYPSNIPHVCVSVYLYVRVYAHTHTHTHNTRILACVIADVCQVYLAAGWRPQCVSSDIYKSYDVLKNVAMISDKHLRIQHIYPHSDTKFYTWHPCDVM